MVSTPRTPWVIVVVASYPPPSPPPPLLPQGNSQYVVVLVGTSTVPTNFMEGLKRMRIIPPHLAAVIGVTSLGPQEAGRLSRKSGTYVVLLLLLLLVMMV